MIHNGSVLIHSKFIFISNITRTQLLLVDIYKQIHILIYTTVNRENSVNSEMI